MVVTCPYCAKEYKFYIRDSHLASHGKTKSDTLLEFPDQKFETAAWVERKKSISDKAHLRLSDPAARRKISETTKSAMKRDDVKLKHLDSVRRPKSVNTIKLLSDKAKDRMRDETFRSKVFTEERNAKIAKSKVEYWKNNADAKLRVASLWKEVRDRDPEKWLTRLRKISQSGFEAAWGKSETEFETRMYSILVADGLHFEKQYVIDGKRFDAFLTSEKVLIEFDGDFWHPLSLDECQYPWQVDNYHNDRNKDEIARNAGIPLLRIRESDVVTTVKPMLANIYRE